MTLRVLSARSSSQLAIHCLTRQMGFESNRSQPYKNVEVGPTLGAIIPGPYPIPTYTKRDGGTKTAPNLEKIPG